MMNMKLLAVVTPPIVYHGCCTHKTVWEGKFTGLEKLTLGAFSAVNTKHYGFQNVSKHKYIKVSDK